MEVNGPLVAELVDVRNEMAKVLQYSSYADYTLEISMTKTPAQVEKFLTDLTNDLMPRAKKEMELLTDLKRTYTADESAVVNSWDVEYYMGRLESEQMVDDAVLMNYFPMEHVIKRTMSIYSEMLGVSFKQADPDCSVWHPDVSCWKTYDTATGELLGQFFLDLLPREGKPQNSACFTI